MEEQTFDQYLSQKKIDALSFKKTEVSLYDEMSVDFAEMHPNSFTSHYLFVINPLRRKYLLKDEAVAQKEKPRAAMKPKIVMKKKSSD